MKLLATKNHVSSRQKTVTSGGISWGLQAGSPRYRQSHLCIVAPGDAPALGQRLSDVLAAGEHRKLCSTSYW